MRIKVPATCFLFSTAFAFAAQPAWELAPPDAKILIGVDIRGLRNSSLAESMTPQMRSQMQARGRREPPPSSRRKAICRHGSPSANNATAWT